MTTAGFSGMIMQTSLDPSTGQPYQFFRLTPHEHVPHLIGAEFRPRPKSIHTPGFS